MKKNVLFTGGSGFVGRNVLPILKEDYCVFSPSRFELNLFDSNAVRHYIIENKIDYIVHSANPNPHKNSLDKNELMLRESLQMFFTLYQSRDLVEKYFFLGSGAIYGKTKDMISVTESTSEDFIPVDDYGFAKFIMNHLAKNNVYNLCLFACYGPSDDYTKFITHCIRCCLRKEPITIRQNCIFDYIHVYDLGHIISWALSNNLKYNTYNICSGRKVSLFDIAIEVKKQMKSDSDIVLLKDGWNFEYTGSNERLISEYNKPFISLEEGISIQIQWEKENYKGGEY